jgi:WD40 repeat protein
MRVAEWHPIGGAELSDIAILKSEERLPVSMRPVPLAPLGLIARALAGIYGVPEVQESDRAVAGVGRWTSASLREPEGGHGWVQLDVTGPPIARGFSGAPVWDEQTGYVIGMVNLAQPRDRLAYMIPLRLLADAWKPLAQLLPTRLMADPDLITYWDIRARGVTHPAEKGWRFTGRIRALRELIAWLSARDAGGQCLRVVTGGPGSGKSAVLARLVTLSDHQYRAQLPTLESEAALGTVPEIGSVDVWVRASRRLLDEVTSLIAEASGLDGSAPEALVASAIERRGVRPMTIVVDALDEAPGTAGLEIARRLLRPLADYAGALILVGTQPQLKGALGPHAQVIDLDSSKYAAVEDIANYVRQTLMRAGAAANTPYLTWGRTDAVAHAVAQRAYPNFLIAQIVGQSLLLRGQPADPDERFPETVGDALDEYLGRLGDWEGRVRRILAPLAYAEGEGLRADDLWANMATALTAADRTVTARDLRDVLKTAGAFLVQGDRAGGGPETGELEMPHRMFHEALAEYLRAPTTVERKQDQDALVSVMLATVPTMSTGQRDFRSAHPYIRANLAVHSSAAGRLDELMGEPTFLLAADRERLLSVLHTVSTPAARRDAAAYRLCVHHLALEDTAVRPSYLQLAACQQKASDLANASAAHIPTGTWFTRWAHWHPTSEHLVLSGHRNTVTTVALEALDSSTLVVSGGADGAVRFWDSESGKPLGIPRVGHAGWVTSLALAERRHRRVVISGGTDGTLRLWDLDTREPHDDPFSHQDGRVSSVAVGIRSGRLVVMSGSSDDSVLRLWDLETGNPISEPLIRHGGPISSLAVGERRGRPVVVSAGPDGAVRIWDLKTGDLVGNPLTGDAGAVNAVAVGERAGRSVVICGGNDGIVRLCDLDTDKAVGIPLTGHAGGVTSVAVGGRGGRTLAVSGAGEALDHGAVRIWDLDTGLAHGQPLAGHSGSVQAVAVGERNGRDFVVSGGSDGTVRLWHLNADATADDSIRRHSGITSIAVGEGDRQPLVIAGASDGAIHSWQLHDGRPVGDMPAGHTGTVTALAVANRGGRPVIVSGGHDCTVRLWDLESGTPRARPLTGHTEGITSLVVGVRGGRPVIVSGSFDCTVRIWDLESGRPVGSPLLGHTQWVTSVALGHCDGRSAIVSGGYDGTVLMWDLEDGKMITSIPASNVGGVTAIAVAEKGGRCVVIAGLDNGTARVWDPENRRFRGDVRVGHAKEICSLAVAERGARSIVASASADGTICEWDLETLEVLAGDAAPIRLDSSAWSLAFSSEGTLVIGTSRGVVALGNMGTRKSIHT